MAKRLSIDPNSGLPNAQLEPASQPTQTYYTPRVPAPQLQAITDLSVLSESLQKVALAQQQRQNVNEVTRLQAIISGDTEASAALQDVNTGAQDQAVAEAARKQNIDKVAAAVRRKDITLAQSPWLPVVYQQM